MHFLSKFIDAMESSFAEAYGRGFTAFTKGQWWPVSTMEANRHDTEMKVQSLNYTHYLYGKSGSRLGDFTLGRTLERRSDDMVHVEAHCVEPFPENIELLNRALGKLAESANTEDSNRMKMSFKIDEHVDFSVHSIALGAEGLVLERSVDIPADINFKRDCAPISTGVVTTSDAHSSSEITIVNEKLAGKRFRCFDKASDSHMNLLFSNTVAFPRAETVRKKILQPDPHDIINNTAESSASSKLILSYSPDTRKRVDAGLGYETYSVINNENVDPELWKDHEEWRRFRDFPTNQTAMDMKSVEVLDAASYFEKSGIIKESVRTNEIEEAKINHFEIDLLTVDVENADRPVLVSLSRGGILEKVRMLQFEIGELAYNFDDFEMFYADKEVVKENEASSLEKRKVPLKVILELLEAQKFACYFPSATTKNPHEIVISSEFGKVPQHEGVASNFCFTAWNGVRCDHTALFRVTADDMTARLEASCSWANLICANERDPGLIELFENWERPESGFFRYRMGGGSGKIMEDGLLDEDFDNG